MHHYKTKEANIIMDNFQSLCSLAGRSGVCVIERKRERKRDTDRQKYRHKKREGKEKDIETIL